MQGGEAFEVEIGRGRSGETSPVTIMMILILILATCFFLGLSSIGVRWTIGWHKFSVKLCTKFVFCFCGVIGKNLPLQFWIRSFSHKCIFGGGAGD